MDVRFTNKVIAYALITLLGLVAIWSSSACFFNKDALDSSSSITHPNIASQQNNWIFFCNSREEGRIYKIRTDGTELTKLSDDRTYNIQTDDEWILYLNFDDKQSIYKICTDGSQRTQILDESVRSIYIAQDWIYYTPEEDTGIYKIRMDGSSKSKITEDKALEIYVLGNWIFYVNISHYDSIYKIRTDGSQRTQILDESVDRINVVKNWIYYTSGVAERNQYTSISSTINKIGTDGSNMQLIYEQEGLILGDFCIVDDWIYYIHEFSVYKIRTDGSDSTFIYKQAFGIISVVDQWIYIFHPPFFESNQIHMDENDTQSFESFRISLDGKVKQQIDGSDFMLRDNRSVASVPYLTSEDLIKAFEETEASLEKILEKLKEEEMRRKELIKEHTQSLKSTSP